MMVDVTAKQATLRRAFTSTRVASVHGAQQRFGLGGPEAEILGTARLAGLHAAKATSELVPLCHPLPLTDLTIDFSLGEDDIEVLASAETIGQTGVEMEALTACALTAVCLLGYLAESDPGASLEELRLLEKRGGRSGTWRFGDPDPRASDESTAS
jgi:cyclic pyranopterin phosphate synthase